MATFAEIPTQPGRPFRETVSWGGVAYVLQFKWNEASQCWTVDIADSVTATPLLSGIAIVTGADLLGQFRYLPVAANTILTAVTIGPGRSPDEIPTFLNFGSDGRLYLVLP